MTPLSYHSSNLSVIALKTMQLLVQKQILTADQKSINHLFLKDFIAAEDRDELINKDKFNIQNK